MGHLDPEAITAYIDAELTPEEMAQVEEHLAGCDVCRAEYDDLRGVSSLVRQLPTYLPSREIVIDGRPPEGSRLLATVIEFSKPLALAAIILLVAFAGLRLLGTFDNEDTGGGEQIPFSVVQQVPVGGTESAARTSGTMRAGESAPAVAGSQQESDGESNETAMQPAPAGISATSAAAPAATAPARPEAPRDERGPSAAMVGVVTIVVLLVAGSAAWYTLRRSPRHRRPPSKRNETPSSRSGGSAP